nr:BCCT family transporter [Escherichia coli]
MWAIYAIVALYLAFFSYRHGLPLTCGSALYPIIGDRIYGPVGQARLRIFAVIARSLALRHHWVTVFCR